MNLRPLPSPPPCGCWGSCLPKIPFFCFETNTLERQREMEYIHQLRRDSRETERELEEMEREMRKLNKEAWKLEERRRQRETEKKEEERERAQRKKWMERVRVVQDERWELVTLRELDRHLQLSKLRPLERESRRSEREHHTPAKKMDAPQQPWTGAGQKGLLPFHSQEDMDLRFEDIQLMMGTGNIHKQRKITSLEETVRRNAVKILQLKEQEDELERELEELKQSMGSMEKNRELESLPELELQQGMERQMKRQRWMEKELQEREASIKMKEMKQKEQELKKQRMKQQKEMERELEQRKKEIERELEERKKEMERELEERKKEMERELEERKNENEREMFQKKRSEKEERLNDVARRLEGRTKDSTVGGKVEAITRKTKIERKKEAKKEKHSHIQLVCEVDKEREITKVDEMKGQRKEWRGRKERRETEEKKPRESLEQEPVKQKDKVLLQEPVKQKDEVLLQEPVQQREKDLLQEPVQQREDLQQLEKQGKGDLKDGRKRERLRRMFAPVQNWFRSENGAQRRGFGGRRKANKISIEEKKENPDLKNKQNNLHSLSWPVSPNREGLLISVKPLHPGAEPKEEIGAFTPSTADSTKNSTPQNNVEEQEINGAPEEPSPQPQAFSEPQEEKQGKEDLKDGRERELKMQETRQEHMAREQQPMRERLRRMFAPVQNWFVSQNGAQNRGFGGRRMKNKISIGE